MVKVNGTGSSAFLLFGASSRQMWRNLMEEFPKFPPSILQELVPGPPHVVGGDFATHQRDVQRMVTESGRRLRLSEVGHAEKADHVGSTGSSDELLNVRNRLESPGIAALVQLQLAATA